MPTHEGGARFRREFARLSKDRQRAFAKALEHVIADADGGRFRPSLRVKKVRSGSEVWEMSFAGDGRAVFMWGEPVREAERHVIWLDIGGHEILDDPR